MVQVRVVGVALDPSQQHVILLKPVHDEPGEGRVLPVWIGAQEAMSILVAVEGTEVPRPLAHDLMTALLREVGTTVERVDVTRIAQSTFYAEITIATPGGIRVLDSRPSDAIALASRVKADIFVADDVMAEAGVPDEAVQVEEGDDEERVEEFRRFLDDVDPEDFER
ncbi:bifunctional nuclease family protein [Microbacterium sp. LMI1-1-1.1]|uniref:bifunctional nuclease family protein n=1 Tax=Microbacterium sp. LMI1-1-1.1 TaxID=3135223 RepID=UPI0034655B93